MEDAEDRAQEALIRLLPHAVATPGLVSTLARYEARTARKRRTREQRLAARLAIEPGHGGAASDRLDVARRLDTWLASLSATDRAVVRDLLGGGGEDDVLLAAIELDLGVILTVAALRMRRSRLRRAMELLL